MWVIHADNLLKLDFMRPHQELRTQGLLEMHDVSTDVPNPGARVTFVSHEWSSFDHPDPHGIQLNALKDMILGLRDGSREPHYDIIAHFRSQLCRPVSIQERKAVTKGYFWLDFFSIPQVCCCAESDKQQVQREMLSAVMSLHTYVAHCSFFVILAPVQYHESGRLMSYSSWKSRGWCQFELAVNGLLGCGSKPVLQVDSKIMWHVNYLSFWQLSPCCGDFTKDEDRYFIADALQQIMDYMEESLRTSQNVHRMHLLQNVRKELLKCHGLGLTAPRKQLKEKMPTVGSLWTSLHYAAALDDVELVRTVLKANADVNARTKCMDIDFLLTSGQTPLHVWAAFSGDSSVADTLLQHRAQVDDRDADGITPLMLSCQMGNEQSCRTLLKLTADPNAQDNLTMSPIWIAVGTDHPNLIPTLLEHQADPHSQWAGMSLLHAAAAHCTNLPWECMEHLLKEGVQVNELCFIRKCGTMGMRLTVKSLFNTNLRKDYSLINGSTALLATTFRGNVGALKTLLRARADPHYFGTSSNRDVMKRSCIPERIFQKLLQESAD